MRTLAHEDNTCRHSAVVSTPFGAVAIDADGEYVRQLSFLPTGVEEIAPGNQLAETAAQQVLAYVDDPEKPFSLPLAPAGTPFQQRVWQAIRRVPVGQICTYGELARNVGSVARATGQACGDNPYPLVVPCHRVVAASGAGGFAHHRDGYLMRTKQWLLAHEAMR